MDVVISDDSLDYDAKQERAGVKTLDVSVVFGNMYTKEIESFSDSILKATYVQFTTLYPLLFIS